MSLQPFVSRSVYPPPVAETRIDRPAPDAHLPVTWQVARHDLDFSQLEEFDYTQTSCPPYCVRASHADRSKSRHSKRTISWRSS